MPVNVFATVLDSHTGGWEIVCLDCGERIPLNAALPDPCPLPPKHTCGPLTPAGIREINEVAGIHAAERAMGIPPELYSDVS